MYYCLMQTFLFPSDVRLKESDSSACEAVEVNGGINVTESWETNCFEVSWSSDKDGSLWSFTFGALENSYQLVVESWECGSLLS